MSILQPRTIYSKKLQLSIHWVEESETLVLLVHVAITRKIDVTAISEVRINNDACKGVALWKLPVPSTLTLPQSFPTSPVLARKVSPAAVHVTKTTEDKSALVMKFLMGFIKFQKGLPLNRDIYFINHTVEWKNGIIMKIWQVMLFLFSAKIPCYWYCLYRQQ